jgi:hypothetical protein
MVIKDSSGNTTFKIAKDTGILTANGADITGKITSTEGKIGNFTIGTYSLIGTVNGYVGLYCGN